MLNELSERERSVLLAGVFELRVTYLEDSPRCAAIRKLVVKLGGDPFAMFFGASAM